MGGKAVVVNCSAPHYNLGAHKIYDWLLAQGYDRVEIIEGDGGLFMPMDVDYVALSAIFSWHVPLARELAQRYKNSTKAVIEAGGPGFSASIKSFEKETGVTPHFGLDMRFDRQRGNYQMTFASRGCPVGCWFCIVPKIEGKEFSFDYEFNLAPMLLDNNISALPDDYQDHILMRYAKAGMKIKDCNSGFEPRTFTEQTYRRWRKNHGWAWRLAFDETNEEEYVRNALKILEHESNSNKRVYVLAGNEPMEQCYERCQKVIEWGAQPWVQAVMPLNAMSKDELIVRHDWTYEKLKWFQQYYDSWMWRVVPIDEFMPSKARQDKPFAGFGSKGRWNLSLTNYERIKLINDKNPEGIPVPQPELVESESKGFVQTTLD